MAKYSDKFFFYFVSILILWSMLMAANFYFQQHEQRKSVLEIAENEANITFMKDALYRRWVTMQGGVYVPVSDFTPPNPYLVHLPDRDITTTDGKELTLVNPAYMTRQVYELAAGGVVQGHLTSTVLMNPVNAPDSWEKEALEALHRGEAQYSNISEINGEPYLRFMRPFHIEAGCLKCHAGQGYSLGDLRGGISVQVPLSEYFSVFDQKYSRTAFMNVLVWLFGTAIIFFTFTELNRMYSLEREQGVYSRKLLQEMNHRVKNNLQIISSILDMHTAESESSESRELLEDIQRRLVSMSTMHGLFEITESRSGVNASEYINKLIGYFRTSYKNGHHLGLSINSDIAEVYLTSEQAVACGLIINELLTNSFKHAFDETVKEPCIRIELHSNENEVTLKYSDNGVGFSDTERSRLKNSYGLMLVDGLAEKLGSKIIISGFNGMSAELVFRLG